tara:strand:- start:501 stop:1280 length:780 start_codon:yes stop_codon:yes gene_type:complete
MYKFIFALLGFQLLGFFGAFLGYCIGSSIDRARNYGIGGINPLGNARRQKVFLETTFVMMGKLAKADGHISKDEINHIEVFIKKIGMTDDHRQSAIQQFKRGSAANDDEIQNVLSVFLKACGQTSQLKQALLMYLIVMALADGNLDLAEEALLEKVALRLGYSQTEFKNFLEMILNQSHFSGNGPTSESSIAEAYKALGVTSECNDQELKKAYRKLMSQNHPDKLMGQGLPEDMIKVATERSQEIQSAYDFLKNHRVKV